MIQIPVSVGELLDKLSILYIKLYRIEDKVKHEFVHKEWSKLSLKSHTFLENPAISDLYEDLLGVNLELWDVEDKLRSLEQEQRFGDEFISLARTVYILNDKRFVVKDRINKLTNSEICEVKSYVNYDNRSKENQPDPRGSS